RLRLRTRPGESCVQNPMLEKKRDSKAGLAEATPHYRGHRERLRVGFREAGADAVSDYELLELLLFRALPRRDVKPLAKSLLEKFGSFAEVIAAPQARAARRQPLAKTVAEKLGLVGRGARRPAGAPRRGEGAWRRLHHRSQ